MKNSTIIIIQAIANVIFLAIIFFKSALNEIVIDWWKEKKEKKKAYKEILVTVKNDVDEIMSALWSILNFAWVESRVPEGEKKQRFFENYQKPAMSTLEKFVVVLRQKRMRLPGKIRDIVDKILEEIVLTLKEATLNPHKGLEILNSVLPVFGKLDKQLSDEIDKI